MADLFEIERGKRLVVENRIKGDRPLITAGYEKTGVAEFISNKEQDIFPPDTITIDMFGNSFYRNYKYSADDNILVLFGKNKILSDAQKFIVNQINKTLYDKFNYGQQFRMGSFNKTKVQLPTKNKKIDFDFMESFISELESQKIKNLEAYLEDNGLKEYRLTEEEKRVLEDFENGNFEWGEFKIGDLFEINSYKKRFDANKVTILYHGKPYVVRTSLNNGVRGYINEDEHYLNDGNTISFGQDTATVFYQEKPYFTGDKIKIIKSKDDKFNKQNAQFFIATMTRSFSSFSWGGSSFNVGIIGNQAIKIPTKNKQPDYQLMETLICAVQKMVVKDVVLYVEEKVSK